MQSIKKNCIMIILKVI